MDINLNLKIDVKEAIFLPGKEVNVKMKELAGDDTSSVNIGYNFRDSLITSIKYSDVELDEINREEKNVVSTSESVYPIYMWYEDGTIYWWSEDKTPALNEDASYMFYLLSVLSDISGLNTFDSFYATSMSFLFSYSGVTSLSYLSNWNTSNVTLMNNVFGGSRNFPMNINSLVDLSKWDTSNVIDMSEIFRCNIQLESLNGLENWNTAKVSDMSHMFDYYLNLNDMFSIKEWDTSSVISFSSMFQHMYNLEKIDVGNWNTSNVTNMCAMFNHQVGLEKLDLSGWDTSNVTDMSYMFSETNLKTIYVSENFTTVKVASSGSMFSRWPSAGVISTPTLIGGNGTIWNENFIDKAYARIDTDVFPGYFTLK